MIKFGIINIIEWSNGILDLKKDFIKLLKHTTRN